MDPRELGRHERPPLSVPGSSGDTAETTADDERKLVGRLRAGDDAAYADLVRTYGGRLLGVAQRILRNPEDARDALQDGFIAAFRAIDSFSGDARISTWLHRIVANAALMKLRARKRQPETPIEDLLPRFLEDGHQAQPPLPWRSESHDELEREERRAMVRSAIDRLPGSYRTVLILRDVEEMSTAETASLLGVTENTVKVRLHRARQALRTLLDPYFKEARP